ncbi:PIN domain-containing protein [Frankia sp. R43]|uniref:PIN domain-containing protein n=1 Tax=Frankia sp. R43 TaxID=269536 RepID=UPI0006CA1610|nr:PIN domain-containing protein [Frankia sp. R43]
MEIQRRLVLDANILIRAVLGRRVRQIILDHSERVSFFAPEVAFADARRYLPTLLEKRASARMRWDHSSR